jgi:hypothetical protein
MAGRAVGDAFSRILFGEGVEDLIDGRWDLFANDPGKAAAEGTPVGERGVAVMFRDGGRPGDGRQVTVVAAEILVAEGSASALLSIGQDEAAFGSHGFLGQW